MTKMKITTAAVVIIVLAAAGYMWWSRAPAEPENELQQVATGCEDAIEEWRQVRADSDNAKTRAAQDALKAAERCQYTSTPEDVSFTTP